MQSDIFKVTFPLPHYFLMCFDLACVDLAKYDHKLSEAAFRQVVNSDDNIFDSVEMKSVFEGLA